MVPELHLRGRASCEVWHHWLQSVCRVTLVFLYPGKVENVGGGIIRHLAPILPTDEHTLDHNRYAGELKMSQRPRDIDRRSQKRPPPLSRTELTVIYTLKEWNTLTPLTLNVAKGLIQSMNQKPLQQESIVICIFELKLIPWPIINLSIAI